MWIEKIVRKEIMNLQGYSSARDENQNLDLIRLDANESPVAPYGESDTLLNRYPEPQPDRLKQCLSGIYGVDANRLLITRGMDEGIDLVIRTFCRPYQDAIVISPPTYSYYKVAADMNAINTIEIKQDSDFSTNWKELPKGLLAKIFFICRPNNPTGALTSLEEIKWICDTYKNESLVVVDEAYIEFSKERSATVLLEQCPNLIVMRTLSKAYGLAALRIGSVIAGEEIIKVLRKVLPPYPIPLPSAVKALEALSPIGLYYTKERIKETVEQRELLIKALKLSPKIERVFPSEGNFVLVTSPNARELYRELKHNGIVVRDRSSYVENSLRISVGTAAENQLLMAALSVPGMSAPKKGREFSQYRRTNETEVFCKIILDISQKSVISTGIPFFDHMLEQLASHAGLNLDLRAEGDLQIDFHHTVEDVALVLGETLKGALGSKRGIGRYGFLLTMDESQTNISVDLSGRGICVFDCLFPSDFIGNFPTEMISHFFSSLSVSLGAGLHIRTFGENSHHMAECIFKGLGRSLRQATEFVKSEHEALILPSTKGLL
jgi:histidinol-phosphate aminotransferase